MRRLKITGTVLVILIIAYFMGPKPAHPVYDTTLKPVPLESKALEQYIRQQESKHHLKPGNNAEIIWHDSLHQKTEYAIVYLHGFSASREEGRPVHTNIAKKFGCNLYLARLAEHGIDTTDALINFTADKLWESAKQALNIGRQLGRKVIVMGTSTGGSLALQLAATYPDIAALVLLSPNIAINNPNAWILNDPWGLQIARVVSGSHYNHAKVQTADYKKYWYYEYRLEAAVQLEEYLETAMTSKTFQRVKQPVLSLYYYKDEEHQDPVIKVSAVREMMGELSTAPELKKEQAIPYAGNHVLGSWVLSKDLLSVEKAITLFMSGTLKIKSADLSLNR